MQSLQNLLLPFLPSFLPPFLPLHFSFLLLFPSSSASLSFSNSLGLTSISATCSLRLGNTPVLHLSGYFSRQNDLQQCKVTLRKKKLESLKKHIFYLHQGEHFEKEGLISFSKYSAPLRDRMLCYVGIYKSILHQKRVTEKSIITAFEYEGSPSAFSTIEVPSVPSAAKTLGA